MDEEKSVNDLLCVEFKNMNLSQLIFCQGVIFPEISAVIDKYADTLIALGDENV